MFKQAPSNIPFPATWFEALSYDLALAEKTCKSYYELSALYEKFLTEFTSLSKETYLKNVEFLQKTREIMASVQTRISHYYGSTFIL